MDQRALPAVTSGSVFLAGTAMRKIQFDAENKLSLLVGFLNEFVYLFQVHHEACERLTITTMKDGYLEEIIERKSISGTE